ncbi:MAG: branched-chain amino acid transporter permease [Bacillales bacterium]|jgi:predicted branched-subunit amino acid permease|nr:branched-chain amino acid transporter permease [Bacillales bacterium]
MLKGIRDGLPLAIGYIPIAVAFGLLANSTQLTFFQTFLMSGIVFAGASQFMALNLLMVSSHYEIVLATFVLNLRHFMMATTIRKTSEPFNPLSKILTGSLLTDESFSVAATGPKPLTAPYMIGLNVTGYLSWVLFSVVGFVFGGFLPESLQESTGIALYAMFVGLLIPAVKGSRKVLMLAIISAVLNTVFTEFSLLSSGWSIIAGTLFSAIFIEFIYRKIQSPAGGV